jgi:soluble methane monooxygenase-binding protein MmoD
MCMRDILARNEPVPGLELPFSDVAVLERYDIEAGGRYGAVIEDLGFMWRWSLYRDREMCQHGCSLSERASREAVAHVLAFYGIRDNGEVVLQNGIVPER